MLVKCWNTYTAESSQPGRILDQTTECFGFDYERIMIWEILKYNKSLKLTVLVWQELFAFELNSESVDSKYKLLWDIEYLYGCRIEENTGLWL